MFTVTTPKISAGPVMLIWAISPTLMFLTLTAILDSFLNTVSFSDVEFSTKLSSPEYLMDNVASPAEKSVNSNFAIPFSIVSAYDLPSISIVMFPVADSGTVTLIYPVSPIFMTDIWAFNAVLYFGM